MRVSVEGVSADNKWRWVEQEKTITLSGEWELIPVTIGNLDEVVRYPAMGYAIEGKTWKLTPLAHGNPDVLDWIAAPGSKRRFLVAVSWTHNGHPMRKESEFELRIPEADGEPEFVQVA